MAKTPPRQRPRRQFDDEFKAQTVRLVLDEGKAVRAMARDLDLSDTALRVWGVRIPGCCTTPTRCTYASEDYQRMLDAHNITCSMSRRGDCYNAVMEAFFSSVKVKRRIASRAVVTPRWSCSTISRCSLTSDTVIRRSVRAVPRRSNDAAAKRMWSLRNRTRRSFPQASHPYMCSREEERSNTETT